jgi:hypothetical protein
MPETHPMALRALILPLALALGMTTAAWSAPQPNDGPQPEQSSDARWSVWGGEVGIEWNHELLDLLGLAARAETNGRQEAPGSAMKVFTLRETGGLDFRVADQNFAGFIGGSLSARGGYRLSGRSGEIGLVDFVLRPQAENAFALDVIGADGKAWFYIDRLMYKLTEDKRSLVIMAMDMRISEALAQRAGVPEFANLVVANMQMSTNIHRVGDENVPLGCSSSKWPGMPAPSGVYEADVFMQSFSAQFSRCQSCDGPAGSNEGLVVYTPSSTLRNNVNNGTAQATIAGDPLGTSTALHAADVAWWQKFTGINEPYDNDQHPYLIWNLYRLDADGRLEQIGRSGVKHAFLTINSGCADNPGCGHILGRGCGDTYGVGNNDSSSSLGPRSEIIPATGQWGRCGSIYDPNCDGSSGDFAGYNSFTHRLRAPEGMIDSSLNPGAQYLFESWYIVRDDINIYNTMQTRRVSISWNGSAWSIANGSVDGLGPAIDHWVDPVSPGAGESSSEIDTAEGHARIAVKTTDVGGGLTRYDYAVMNLDFARAITEGAEPNLRVLSNAGFDSFSVPLPEGVAISDIQFGDGDLDAANDWASAVDTAAISWTAPEGLSLDWGTMMRFSFVADSAPVASSVNLGVANPGAPASFSPAALAPAVNTAPAANQTPEFSAGSNPSVVEDAGAQVIAGWASDIDDGDLVSQGLSFAVSNVGDPSLFSVQPSVSANGDLSFTPAPDANGSTTFDLVLNDDGTGTSGGPLSSAPVQVSVEVRAVNDAPAFSAANPSDVIIADGTPVSISGWAGGFDPGPENEAGQAVLGYVVSNVSNPGMFTVAPSVNAAGDLSYTVAPAVFGSVQFSVAVRDDGGTLDGGVDTGTPQVFTLNVQDHIFLDDFDIVD